MASTISVDTIQGSTVAGNVKLPAGCVLQVLNTLKTDTFTYSGTSQVEITGLSVTITPKFSTSKILIMFNVHMVGLDAGTGLQLFRGSTALAMGDTASNRMRYTAVADYANPTADQQYSGGLTSHIILDSPNTTSATTYKIYGQVLSQSFIVNKTRYDVDNGNASRGVSTITAMEIAQ